MIQGCLITVEQLVLSIENLGPVHGGIHACMPMVFLNVGYIQVDTEHSCALMACLVRDGYVSLRIGSVNYENQSVV